MTVDLRRYEQLKQKVDQYQREADRAAGALAQLLERLKEEFGCDSIEEAEKLARKLKKERDKTEKEFAEALEEFETEWGGELE